MKRIIFCIAACFALMGNLFAMNIEEAKRLANAGDAEIQYLLGACYENGEGVQKM